jgi:hypothetical protein
VHARSENGNAWDFAVSFVSHKLRPTLLLAAFAISLLLGGALTFGQDLDSIRRNAASRNTELERRAIVDIRNLRNAEASQIALPLLRDKDSIVRASAAGAVVYLPPDEAAAALIPLLGDKEEFVRQEAAYALGDAGSLSGVGALVRAVQKDTAPVRNASLVALGKIGDTSAVKALTDVLRKKPNEDNEFMFRAAARSIGQIAEFQRTGRVSNTTPKNYLPTKYKETDPAAPPVSNVFQDAVPVLMSVLQNSKQADDSRREAAFALGAIGDQSAVTVLRSHLNSPDNHLAEICKEALIKLGEPQ